ncbi:hypothetical protein HTZ97_13710 [Desulfuromonas acetoxidans]|uniref:Replication-associated protein ORF2/G2P domain-containing protein n=1 Tax=Desulfuromonas acetoxidans (strain DSM 684 / 11070) TaxID=281689 RepID=Q1K1S8_DESA6|nr:hypothetical protein [Desulfuromonas acetoxidans]EAT16310.1 hypothetical protein Dace_1774 [Desulfuromonas acetoxidans DSM 684]MBF0644873.1 hypothetical protein [Desulfuromonas acetoxidans]NVD25390.1 hypothetical protein [Desulfuromonas acetoxidans]NVE17509.1 hypothetical protein [Desulfuromonas acetoxidans]
MIPTADRKASRGVYVDRAAAVGGGVDAAGTVEPPFSPDTVQSSGHSADLGPHLVSEPPRHRGAEVRGGAKPDGPLVTSPISQTFEVPTFHVYPATVKIKRPFIGKVPVAPDRTRTSIQGFSDKSRGRLRFVAANSRDKIKTQFCMTYGDVWPINGRSLKADLNRFLTNVRKQFPGMEYIWIAEFQTRGCPHFHLFSSIPLTDENHQKLTKAWHRVAGYGQDKHLRVHSHDRNFIEWDLGKGSYLCKYLDKEAQKAIPEGFSSFGRWWGNSRTLVDVPDEIPSEYLDETYGYESIDLDTGEDTGFTPSKWIYRQLGRYQEALHRDRVRKIKELNLTRSKDDKIPIPPRPWFRHTNKSTSSFTGAPVFNRLLAYAQSVQPESEKSPF